MDRPYGISDFAFPTQWDRESGPDLVERAGRVSRTDREQTQTGREKGSNSARSRGGFDRPVTIYRGRDREYSLRETEVRIPAYKPQVQLELGTWCSLDSNHFLVSSVVADASSDFQSLRYSHVASKATFGVHRALLRDV